MAKTIDDLWKHLDDRLNKQDEERKAIAQDVGKLTTDVEVLKKGAEGDKAACQAQHSSARRRIGRIEAGFIAIFGAAAAALVFGKSGA